MSINGNIGNIGYVLTAVAGALIALGGLSSWYMCGAGGAVMSLGTLVAFLNLQKNFTRPISNISNDAPDDPMHRAKKEGSSLR